MEGQGHSTPPKLDSPHKAPPPPSSQLSQSQETAFAKERRDRVAQSGMEYWKAQYDFYKHFMTISLASIAAYGAVLGGLIMGPLEKSVTGDLYSTLLYGLFLWTFLWLATAAIWAVSGMRVARRSLWEMRTVNDEEDFEKLWHESSLARVWLITGGSFTLGTTAFLVLVCWYGLAQF
jgi:hypothetical protein